MEHICKENIDRNIVTGVEAHIDQLLWKSQDIIQNDINEITDIGNILLSAAGTAGSMKDSHWKVVKNKKRKLQKSWGIRSPVKLNGDSRTIREQNIHYNDSVNGSITDDEVLCVIVQLECYKSPGVDPFIMKEFLK